MNEFLKIILSLSVSGTLLLLLILGLKQIYKMSVFIGSILLYIYWKKKSTNPVSCPVMKK